jgi:hypothetical protein
MVGNSYKRSTCVVNSKHKLLEVCKQLGASFQICHWQYVHDNGCCMTIVVGDGSCSMIIGK